MIKTLRKRHLQIWILWAVLLPVGIIVASIAVPKEVTQELLQDEKIEIFPVVLGTDANKGKYYSYLRMNRNGTKFQLCWKAYNGFDYSYNIYTHPLLIYVVTGSERELIGRVGGNRSYCFNLPNDSSDTYKFIVYDPLHKKDITSLNFNKR